MAYISDPTLDRALQELADRFAVVSELGRGGSAVVLLVRDIRHERDVALKLMRPEIALMLGTDRFKREIVIEAGLQHPNILPLFDSGWASGIPWFVTPLVRGGSLRERCDREGALPIPEALRIAAETADALAHAHARGVVHRDIKPENILLDDGRVLVADFGIARQLSHHELSRTTTGVLVGTPRYMSPEQASGAPDIDARSDLYSLGCVLFEMLAARPPFEASAPQALLARHLTAEPPDVRSFRPATPPEAAGVVRRLLAKEPAGRPQSADELSVELRAVKPTTQELRPRVRRHPERRRWLVWGAASVLVLAAVLWLWWPRGPALDPHRIVIFPPRLVGVDSVSVPPEAVAVYLGHVLGGTEPLRWESGGQALRQAGGQADAKALARIARQRGARYYIDGSILRVGDSATVVLRLHDARDNRLVRSNGRHGAADSYLPQLAADAVVDFLPDIAAPGAPADPSELRGRAPAAVANFLLGEAAYRAGRFGTALEFYGRAAADSQFPLAAVQAALSASWLDRTQQAESLADVAFERRQLLSARYRHLLDAFRFYSRGAADSALGAARRAIESDSLWAEAWMVAGEVLYHLLPDTMPLDSLARRAMERARELEPGFLAPLYHLTELALQRDDLATAQSLLDTLSRGSEDTVFLAPLAMAVRCVTTEMSADEWREAADQRIADALEAAKSLSTSDIGARCARTGFRAALWEPSAIPAQRFGALLGLHALLLRAGQRDSARALLNDDGVAALRARWLFIVDAVTGQGFEEEARATVGDLEDFAGSPTARWLLALYASHAGLASVASEHASWLRHRADSTGAPAEGQLAAIAEAHARLAARDTTGAIAALATLHSASHRREIAWGLWAPLGWERLTLARLRLARGAPDEALRTAAAFDASQPLAFLPLQRDALLVRLQAARALERRRLAHAFADRLERFKRSGAGSSTPRSGESRGGDAWLPRRKT